MELASVIVEIEDGASETVLSSLARIPTVNVYGIKENQIVTVIEGDTAQALEESMRKLSSIEQVIGVYPVFAGKYE